MKEMLIIIIFLIRENELIRNINCKIIISVEGINYFYYSNGNWFVSRFNFSFHTIVLCILLWKIIMKILLESFLNVSVKWEREREK